MSHFCRIFKWKFWEINEECKILHLCENCVIFLTYFMGIIGKQRLVLANNRKKCRTEYMKSWNVYCEGRMKKT